jgi:hypothetical protein
MSKFFESDIVRKTISELDELQTKIISEMFFVPSFSNDRKKKHLKLLRDFLEKQKLFIFRVSLSDDKDAVEMMESILNSAKLLGYGEINSVDRFFEKLDDTIEKLEQTIDT